MYTISADATLSMTNESYHHTFMYTEESVFE